MLKESNKNHSPETNFHYLMEALVTVHQALSNYISRQENKPIEEFFSPTTDNPELKIAQSITPYALEDVCKIFGLSDFERFVLLLCAGMELEPTWSVLCTKAHRNDIKAYPTFRLAFAAFNKFDWGAMRTSAPLRRWGLIEFGANNTSVDAPLRINEQIFHYILGYYELNEQLVGMVRQEQIDDIPTLVDSHQQLVEQIVTTWKQSSQEEAYFLTDLENFSDHLATTPIKLEHSNNGTNGNGFCGKQLKNKYKNQKKSSVPIIQLCGNEFASKKVIAQTICSRLQLKLYVLSANNLPTDPKELDQFFLMWEREALLGKSLLLLDCDDINTGNIDRLNIIKSSIELIKSPLIISSSDRISSKDTSILTFEVYKPNSEEQRKIWQNVLGYKSSEVDTVIDNLVSHFNLSAPEINSAHVKALTVNELEAQRLNNPSNSLLSLLWNSCRTQAQPKLDELGQRMHLKATWDDLVLDQTQRQTLESIAAHVQQRIQVYQKWGFAGKSGRGLGISALFAGTSGTGKTMSAEVLANELNLDLYRIDLSTTVSKYIGETEKNLRRIFDAAEGAGAILLFDEADALFGKRSEVKDARDRYANMEVSYLLQRMEEYQGLAILTTNLKGSIDTAFLRRIRFIVKYSFPDVDRRKEIWRRVFPKNTPTQDLNFAKLAKLNVAGGNIRNIALNAAFIAADSGEPVMMKHLLIATKSEYVKLERILTDSEIKGWV
ncbi:hypothetical protein BC008_45305 [Mastigocoleus testarum BC008]|uniref:AAA+ ATPase domain-containing protein n=2 Tax=Mastigocoleus TaxID=996924 RepID=A0A0V8A149_9CYAN|nr:hypothetical protein BC008_45305 [Mastigocoleus testarum BC008]